MSSDLLINKQDIAETKFKNVELENLNENEVRLELIDFAFTANNITYAATGHNFKYWDFFPADEGWGKLPVWGFATIAESKHPELSVGETIYGYFPLATHLTVIASNVKDSSFVDAANHRQALNPFYNTYTRTRSAAGFEPELNHRNAILRPMFATSFLIEDFFADANYFGATDLVLSSASSKTAIGTAFLFQKTQDSNYKVIALTSEANRPFVESLGCYDQIFCYEDLSQLDNRRSAAYIDFAGNRKLRHDLHYHYDEQLKCSSMIGLAHWQQAGSREDLPGARPEVFFAPAQAQKRIKDWGSDGFQQKLGSAWLDFLKMADEWIEITEGKGQDAIQGVYQAMLEGKADPKKGYILSF